MGHRNNFSWDKMSRRERPAREKALFGGQNTPHRKPAPLPPKTSKADLRAMMAEAAANTARLK